MCPVNLIQEGIILCHNLLLSQRLSVRDIGLSLVNLDWRCFLLYWLFRTRAVARTECHHNDLAKPDYIILSR